MNYQLQYNYCAILIYLIVLITHLMKKKTNELHNKVFTVIVAVSLTGVIVNIFNTMGNMNILGMPDILLNILNYIYFITLNLISFIYAIYAVTLTKNSILHTNWKLKFVILGPICVVMVLLISNPYTHAYFNYIDGVYQRGSYQILMYAVSLYYAAFGVGYVLREEISTTKAIKGSLLVFFLFGCITALIQYLEPELLIQHLGLSVCELIILLNFQNTEEYLHLELNIYNKFYFERVFRLNRQSDKSLDILMINIEDMNFIMQTVGMDVEKSLLKEIAGFLDEISDKDVYYIESNVFFIMKQSNKSEEIDVLIDKIEKRFEEKWGQENDRIYINHKLMKVRVPEDIPNLDLLYFCNTNFVEMPSTNRNMVRVRDVDFNKAGRKMKVEKIIKRAIAEDNFHVYYQPIYSFHEGRIVSAEALLRLIDPEDGFIPPDEFIPIAEQNGTIIKIGEMVFEKVFRFMSENDIKKLGIKYIEINLSVIQCMQEELAAGIIDLLDKYKVGKEMINLEITETAAVDSPKVLLKNMKELFEAGITFSLDDFGTGYSNINSLMSLPLNIIKFDKTLVDMASKHERGKGVIDSSVAMVKKMGLEIVAEGIEEEPQIYMLKEMGVDYLQGYYFSKPLPQDKFLTFIIESGKKKSLIEV